MPFFEDLGFAAGGGAEGMLAAEQIRTTREANEIRRARQESLGNIEQAELERMPTPEQAQEAFQVEQDTARAEMDIALEKVAETERGNEVVNINDRIADTFEGETQGMVDFLAQQGAAFGVDGAGGMKTRDWETFMEHFRSEDGKPLRKEFANIGMNEIKAPLEAITGDLDTLRAKHAKTPSSKSLETIGIMEQGIDEMKRSNNAFQSIFNEASEAEEDGGLPTKEKEFLIQEARRLADEKIAAGEDTSQLEEYIDIVGRIATEKNTTMAALLELLRMRSGGGGSEARRTAPNMEKTNPLKLEPPIQ